MSFCCLGLYWLSSQADWGRSRQGEITITSSTIRSFLLEPVHTDGLRKRTPQRGNRGSQFYRINTGRGTVIPFTHRESLRKVTAQWGLWCYHFSRFFLTIAFIDFRAIPHTCVKLTLSPPPPPTPTSVATWAI